MNATTSAPARVMISAPAHGDNARAGEASPSSARGVPPVAAKVRMPVAAEPSTSDPSAPATRHTAPKVEPPVLADPMLALLADVLDDLERTRIANENRLRQLTRIEVDADGIERGFGLTLDQLQAASVASLVAGLAAMEHQATLSLRRALRAHPLGPWIASTAGVGEKQGARLLAAIGDPYWNTLHDRPRTVSELWAYCGYHVLPVGGHLICGTHRAVAADGAQAGTGHTAPATHRRGADAVVPGGDTGQKGGAPQVTSAGVAPRRARGQRANWSTTAKMRAFLVAESCIKCRQSPYRLVYDATRAKYSEATHAVVCVRCGPAGMPAPVGSALSDGHKHARALRAVAKQVLKDLWREAKQLHEACGVGGDGPAVTP